MPSVGSAPMRTSTGGLSGALAAGAPVVAGDAAARGAFGAAPALGAAAALGVAASGGREVGAAGVHARVSSSENSAAPRIQLIVLPPPASTASIRRGGRPRQDLPSAP